MECRLHIKEEIADEGYEGPFVLELNESALEDIAKVIGDDMHNTGLSVQPSNDKDAPDEANDVVETRTKSSLEGKTPHGTITKLKRGRKPQPKAVKAPVSRNCPICHKSMLTSNLTRHLRDFHKVTSVKKLSKLSLKATKEAAGTSPPPKPVRFDELPKGVRNNWADKENRVETLTFLKNHGLYLDVNEELNDEKN